MDSVVFRKAQGDETIGLKMKVSLNKHIFRVHIKDYIKAVRVAKLYFSIVIVSTEC